MCGCVAGYVCVGMGVQLKEVVSAPFCENRFTSQKCMLMSLWANSSRLQI